MSLLTVFKRQRGRACGRGLPTPRTRDAFQHGSQTSRRRRRRRGRPRAGRRWSPSPGTPCSPCATIRHRSQSPRRPARGVGARKEAAGFRAPRLPRQPPAGAYAPQARRRRAGAARSTTWRHGVWPIRSRRGARGARGAGYVLLKEGLGGSRGHGVGVRRHHRHGSAPDREHGKTAYRARHRSSEMIEQGLAEQQQSPAHRRRRGHGLGGHRLLSARDGACERSGDARAWDEASAALRTGSTAPGINACAGTSPARAHTTAARILVELSPRVPSCLESVFYHTHPQK